MNGDQLDILVNGRSLHPEPESTTRTYIKFYVVWNERTGYTKFKHPSCRKAKLEAERLALSHPGETFHVLQTVGRTTLKNVTWQDAEDLPF